MWPSSIFITALNQKIWASYVQISIQYWFSYLPSGWKVTDLCWRFFWEEKWRPHKSPRLSAWWEDAHPALKVGKMKLLYHLNQDEPLKVVRTQRYVTSDSYMTHITFNHLVPVDFEVEKIIEKSKNTNIGAKTPVLKPNLLDRSVLSSAFCCPVKPCVFPMNTRRTWTQTTATVCMVLSLRTPVDLARSPPRDCSYL